MIRTDKKLLDAISYKARHSSRKRQNHNFHKSESEVLQRMLNALEPGTYIRPHKHENPGKNEVFMVLRGRILVLEYNEDGSIRDHVILDKATENFATEIPPGRYHSMIPLDPGTVAYEMKEGPYHPGTDKLFAPWSPEECSNAAEAFLQNIFDQLGISLH
ncbi:MAG TPA: WbuC family cupin fold metalloprotein [Bacteroidales bacterium]|nr:WbuC family cupin fold metalloprotein [Bacteroidales bacterium]